MRCEGTVAPGSAATGYVASRGVVPSLQGKSCFNCVPIASAATKIFRLNPPKHSSVHSSAHSAQRVPFPSWKALVQTAAVNCLLDLGVRWRNLPTTRLLRSAFTSQLVAKRRPEPRAFRPDIPSPVRQTGAQNLVFISSITFFECRQLFSPEQRMPAHQENWQHYQSTTAIFSTLLCASCMNGHRWPRSRNFAEKKPAN